MLVTINDYDTYEYENYIFPITREGLKIKGVSSCRDLSVRKYVQSVTLSRSYILHHLLDRYDTVQ